VIAWVAVERRRVATPAEQVTSPPQHAAPLASAPIATQASVAGAPSAPIASAQASVAGTSAPASGAAASVLVSEPTRVASPSFSGSPAQSSSAPERVPAPTAPRAPINQVRSTALVPASARPNATASPAELGSASAEQPVDPLQAEAAALRSAQLALRSGDARRALELLAEQERDFRGGALAEERFAARVLALCEAHEPNAARREAQRFENRYPASALLGKVRSACRDQ